MSKDSVKWITKTGAMMSGMWWYDRFIEELAGEIFPFSNRSDDDVISAVNKCKEAAKRASEGKG